GSSTTCNAACVNAGLQTICRAGDGCCPAGCNSTNDADCSVRCGNGTIESGETCDGNCPTAATCVSDRDNIRLFAGDPTMCGSTCTVTARACGSTTDGFCPSACTAATDID